MLLCSSECLRFQSMKFEINMAFQIFLIYLQHSKINEIYGIELNNTVIAITDDNCHRNHAFH